MDRARHIFGVAMLEWNDRAIQKLRGIRERGMRSFVKQRMGEAPGQRLGNYQVGHVATGDEQGIFGTEKIGETPFQFPVQNMVARGEPGGSHVQAVLFDAGAQGGYDPRVTRKTKIIAPGKVGELAVAKANEGAVELLEGSGFGHCQEAY